MDPILNLAGQWGPVAFIIVYFIWRDGKREDRLAKRLDEMQAAHVHTLETTVAASTNAAHEMSVSVNKLTEAIERLAKEKV